MAKRKLMERDLHFIGTHKNDSIVIGNYGNASITAIGNFDLSGLIFCPRSTVELSLTGDGSINFNGTCKELVLRQVDGNCSIDLSNLACKMVRCEMVKGNSVILLGEIRYLDLISIDENTVIKYDKHPLLINHDLHNNLTALKSVA